MDSRAGDCYLRDCEVYGCDTGDRFTPSLDSKDTESMKTGPVVSSIWVTFVILINGNTRYLIQIIPRAKQHSYLLLVEAHRETQYVHACALSITRTKIKQKTYLRSGVLVC